MNDSLFEYRGDVYPTYLREGNACRFITPIAAQFCRGVGLDVGSGPWPFPGALAVELKNGGDAMELPHGQFDYVLASHSLEHLVNPIAALEHWQSRIKPGGVLFLYLPHPDQKYWRPQNCRKHLHSWAPEQMVEILRDLGFLDVIFSGRDLAWSFACVAWRA